MTYSKEWQKKGSKPFFLRYDINLEKYHRKKKTTWRYESPEINFHAQGQTKPIIRGWIASLMYSVFNIQRQPNKLASSLECFISMRIWDLWLLSLFYGNPCTLNVCCVYSQVRCNAVGVMRSQAGITSNECSPLMLPPLGFVEQIH